MAQVHVVSNSHPDFKNLFIRLLKESFFLQMIHNISDSDEDLVSSTSRPEPKKPNPKKRRTKEEIAAEKEAKRVAREEREAQRLKERAYKPGECLKFFEASVDVTLVEHALLGPPILAALHALPGLTVRLCKEPLVSFKMELLGSL